MPEIMTYGQKKHIELARILKWFDLLDQCQANSPFELRERSSFKTNKNDYVQYNLSFLFYKAGI